MIVLRISMALAAFFALTNGARAHDGATARYIGNEGILVNAGDATIVFDAFYADSYGQYQLPPEEIEAALISGEAPYDGIDAVFVSHVHGDHFTAEKMLAFLRAQPQVKLYGPSQIRTALLDAGVSAADPVFNRLVTVSLSPTSSPQQISIGALEIDVVAVPHSGNRPEIENLTWRVSVDGAHTVLHMGDADTSVASFSRHLRHFNARKTDTAFPPYWFLLDADGQLILRDIIRAENIIGVHVPARARGRGDEWRRDLGGDVFTDPGEIRELGLE